MKKTRTINLGLSALAVLTASAAPLMAEPRTNMMHQWAQGSEAAAIAKLGEMYEAAGGIWEQTAISGHTSNTLAKLRSDVVAGNAPAAVQLKGPEIIEWNSTGQTANLDELATAEGWDDVVAPELISVMKPTGHWVAVPMNIHRVNWLYSSKKLLDELEIEVPRTWEEFNAACDKVVAAGKTCIAHGAADWSDTTTFDSVVYGMDIDLYRKAFQEADIEAMRSQGMIDAFAQLRKMVGYMDDGINGRSWEQSMTMTMTGEAAFFLMGDWTVASANLAGFKEGVDYLCDQTPVDWGGTGYILNADSVVMFKQSDPDYVEGQKLLAKTIMSPEFQVTFNVAKGSIPSRTDVDLSKGGFTQCQQKSLKDLQASVEEGTLVRSMAHNMTVLQKFRGAMMEVITEFVADDSITPEEAANQLADAVELQM
ncbi:ABC transporter substrate-binding protein [Paracoccus seriniphilus]|uniref:Probable sugar-binding periplasmic protein n=1 Tax=Paracoccus seriniphilus TaxID=184748 RepID=A0A239PTC5_9RHOB|nr:ABC transporter substrate-binding protein [Paracoccus seriniphilus]WCR16434.1 carbohydrate ABC transporter substrate-binding protein [Paracoccus seriniphilus]SNT73544.1 glucose/mannose transport system substrate-binding protein [Paracoccus seriniphilus]